ncbi:hypothetical protein GUJ93_ZPchr0006g45370 [Zizania palustris]|uniref:Uncharacterized protein n=1 Tax=Zizania palustris TaxID=103762 RepID=A0A8J5VPB6_ZIZPA|nr:hypothetical protein GUJ93_ZPchr0006g45370 [Zizania palustris]
MIYGYAWVVVALPWTKTNEGGERDISRRTVKVRRSEGGRDHELRPAGSAAGAGGTVRCSGRRQAAPPILAEKGHLSCSEKTILPLTVSSAGGRRLVR